MPDHNENKLNYRVSGNGHPVVFLHGFLESMRMWDCFDFDTVFTQICIDLPGHGLSVGRSEDMRSMKAMALCVMNILAELKIEQYDLVGHSMGGYVGLELMRMDKRCRKLVLMNSNFWSDDVKKQKDRQRVADIVRRNKMIFIYEAIPNLFYNPKAHDGVVQALIKEAGEMNAEAIAEATIAMSKRDDLSDFVKAESHRVLVIQGAQDTVVPIQKMQKLQKQYLFDWEVLNDCGHMAHIEQTEITARRIIEFVEKK